MRKTLVLTLALVAVASIASAQTGTVGMYADVQGTDCNIVDNAAGLLTVNAVHVTDNMGQDSFAAVQFRAQVPACFTGTFLSSAAEYPVSVGNVETGIAIGYGACLGVPIHAASVSLFASGTTPACCLYVVDGDPGEGSNSIVAVDCIGTTIPGGVGLISTINGDVSCTCPVATPTEDTTWGKVKALYEGE